MAHFARLDENNIVLEVLALDNAMLLDNGVESEQKGVEVLSNWRECWPHWKQTSYNGNFRKNYAGIGYTYDAVRDAFIPPKPYPSWILDEDTCRWNPPTPIPTDGMYQWDEATLAWVAP